MDEIIETENSNIRGANFEKRFAEFMKTNLGWSNSKVRVQLKSKSNNKGTNVDVVGIMTDKRYDFYGKFAWSCWIGGTILLFIGFIFLVIEIKFNIGWAFVSLAVSSLGCAIGLFIYRINFRPKHGWVECKDLIGKATYPQVEKCLHEYNSYKKTGDTKFNFIKIIFVSTNGFMENAHALAIENDFECYVVKEGKFELYPYWE